MAESLKPIIAALRSGRELWVPIGQGKAIKVRRPPESEFHHYIKRNAAGNVTAQASLEHVQAAAVDWRGFTEADLLGPTVGTVDPLAFDADVWREAVADRMDWMQPVADALVEAIVKHVEAKAADSGNSRATSTPGPAAEVAAVQMPATTPTTPSP